MPSDLSNPTALKLLLTAERLFAEEGIDAVSTRRISTEAGQRNNSSLQYHFGCKESLLETLLDYRQLPINERRLDLLERAREEGLSADVKTLVEALVLPYSELLLADAQCTHYISLVSQLYSQQRLGMLFGDSYERTRSLLLATDWLRTALVGLDDAELEQRLLLMGITLIHSMGLWAHERRCCPEAWPPAQVRQRSTVLVHFLVAALQAGPGTPDNATFPDNPQAGAKPGVRGRR